jgi:hypothetical protein
MARRRSSSSAVPTAAVGRRSLASRSAESAELLLNEPRQAAALMRAGGRGAERLEVIAHDLVARALSGSFRYGRWEFAVH